MRSYILITAIGQDRVGIVDDIAAILLSRKCNIEESRMALLGGDFAALVLASGDPSAVASVIASVSEMERSLQLTISAKETSAPTASLGCLPYFLESSSLDSEGIVHAVTAVLRRYSVNIADLETETVPAPWTGAPLFNLKARLSIPREASISHLRTDLEALETELNLDIRLYPAVTTREIPDKTR